MSTSLLNFKVDDFKISGKFCFICIYAVAIFSQITKSMCICMRIYELSLYIFRTRGILIWASVILRNSNGALKNVFSFVKNISYIFVNLISE